jgi:3-oxoacyl-(acyl-carrier-protein) synthase
MILGMGAVGIVVESAAAARERGIAPICELLGAVTANSAFHGSRLHAEHIGEVMESVLRRAEAHGVSRSQMAPQTVFVSHETYTPPRGGAAAAEIQSLRHVFGDHADEVVIANTKGATGHAMGVAIEDVVAIKVLETGLVPPVANFREVDPVLGRLNLSTGGSYPVHYALRLGAGFGSQISMLLLRHTPNGDGHRQPPDQLGFHYRIADQTAWTTWLRSLCDQPQPQLEVVKRRLRIAATDAAHDDEPAHVPERVAYASPE